MTPDELSVASRRASLAPGTPVGVTEPMIEQLVHAFYAKIRGDPALGPIFTRVIPEDRWPVHLGRMCDFWSSVTLMTGRFKGSPMAAHAKIDTLRPTHFARWLHLFGETVAEVCPPEAAQLFMAKADMIAQSLQLGLAASRGELPPVRGAAAPDR